MYDVVSPAVPAGRVEATPGRIGRARFAQPSAAVALALYLGAAGLMLGGVLVDPSAHRCICHSGDVNMFTWSLAWFPRALTHGADPLHTSLIYVPQGLNLALGTPALGAALLMWPVTWATDPLFAYDVTMLLCPALSAFFAFLLCRRLCRSFWPALLGGWVFGFSPYMFGQLQGHMNLTLMMLVPALVHLVLRGLGGELSSRRFTVLFTLALLLQFSFSAEVFVTFTLAGALALALAAWRGDRGLRRRVVALLGPILLAYCAVAVVASPYIYAALQPGGVPILPKRVNVFSADLASFIVPTPLTALGGASLSSTSGQFTAGLIEGGTYLGLPLLAILALNARRIRGQVGLQVALGTLIALVVCSLGGRLHVVGQTGVPLPWTIATHLPVLGLIIPVRFVAYVYLIAGIVLSMWLAERRRRPLPWALALAAAVCLWPALSSGTWNTQPPMPRLFTDAAYRHVLNPHDVVFMPPVGSRGYSMLWQAESGLRFPQAGGYFLAAEAHDPYRSDPIYPTLRFGSPVPDLQRRARDFLTRHRVTVAVIDSAVPEARPWRGILARLGWRGRRVGGAVVMRPRTGHPLSR